MTQNPLLQYDESLRTSYLVLLASIATADHENSEGEIAFMQQMAAVSELGANHIQEVTKAMTSPSSVDFQGHFARMKQSDLKYALAADIINMVQADGDMDQGELNQVARINTALDISQEQFNVMTEYVQEANNQAKQQVGTPGLMGLMGGSESDGGGTDMGNLLGMATDFLSKSGLSSKFQQAGIPAQNFESGSTLGTVLTGLASSLIQSKLGGTQGNTSSGSMGNVIGGLVGSMLGGGNSGVQSRGVSNGGNAAGGGLGDMLAGVIGSPQGQEVLSGILGKVMGNNQQGKGLSNMSEMLGGGRKSGDALGNLVSMFMK